MLDITQVSGTQLSHHCDRAHHDLVFAATAPPFNVDNLDELVPLWIVFSK